MKSNVIIILLLLTICTAGKAHRTEKIDCLFNLGKVNIESVVYTPQATIISFTTTEQTDSIFAVNHGIYLIDDKGERHHAIRAEGISFDSVYQVEKERPRSFSVAFTPVDEHNSALDVINPGHFSIYGIHDSGTVLNIPSAKDCYSQSYHPDDKFFQPQETVIEGVIHGGGSNGSTLLFLMRTTTGEKQPVCTVDESGHFSMRFTLSCPKLALLDDAGTRRSLAYLFVRPGDHLYVDIYGGNDGTETKVENRNGEYACPKLANIHVGTWKMSFNYISNLQPQSGQQNQAFSKYSPEEHWKILMDDYASNMHFADYMCWHNCLSPFESRLYLESTEMYYGWMLCELGARLCNMVYAKETSPQLADIAARVDDILVDRFYTLTRDIQPDSPTLIYGEYCSSLSHLFDSYPAKKRCDSILETETDYCERMLKTQMDVIHRITGWDDESLLMQYNEILALNRMMSQCSFSDKYRKAHASELRQLYASVRREISNPCLLRQLDAFYEQNNMAQ